MIFEGANVWSYLLTASELLHKLSASLVLPQKLSTFERPIQALGNAHVVELVDTPA
jgi:hypothetical protein